ncbi:MAG: hypothetical protein AAFU84_21400, partial [Cyanobacteria bacterium J06633_23]
PCTLAGSDLPEPRLYKLLCFFQQTLSKSPERAWFSLDIYSNYLVPFAKLLQSIKKHLSQESFYAAGLVTPTLMVTLVNIQ